MVPMVVRQAVDNIPVFVRVYAPLADSVLADGLYWSFFRTLILYGLVILGLSLVSGLFSFLMRQTIVVASRHIEYDLRNQLYDHIQQLDRAFYTRNSDRRHHYPVPPATSNRSGATSGPAIMYLTRALFIVVTALIVMVVISPRLTMFAVIPMPFLAVSVFFGRQTGPPAE